ncbi:tyrosine-type recombinase/integrase [Dankookia sp. P2]|uniref:tyrosine-type recombinase/integrase n=1 Tax=Dankookia sp. P2 TaxID=3423955 RepID=UPI003D67AF14
MKAIARHWVKVTPAHLEQISALQRRLEVRSRTLTETNRARLRQFDDPGNIRALLGLPARLLALAERIPARQQHRAALLVQSAVAIELLLMTPVRIDNLAALDLDRHLLRPNRRGAGLHLVIPGTAVKNRQDLEFPLPAESIALLECYLEGYRPVLATATCRALFPGRDGGRKARAVLGRQISRAVFQHTGLQLHPHLFRHITAKLYLDANPGSYEVVRRVLGHRSIETTTSYYTGLETAAAVRHFDATILKLRKPNGGDRT